MHNTQHEQSNVLNVCNTTYRRGDNVGGLPPRVNTQLQRMNTGVKLPHSVPDGVFGVQKIALFSSRLFVQRNGAQ